MAVERTLSIIKPDAVAKNVIGQIYARFEEAGLRIVAAQMPHLSQRRSRGLLRRAPRASVLSAIWCDFMISGPVMIQVLEGENAIAKNRELMGATDPKKAATGTIRADFAESSTPTPSTAPTAPETAAIEIAYFFPALAMYALTRETRAEADDAAPARRTHHYRAQSARSRSATDSTPLFAERSARSRFARARCSAGSTSAAPTTSTRMTDLAKPLRAKLSASGRGPRADGDCATRTAADGTRKWLLDVGAGNAVETVFIPEDDRGTLCISSQAGCALDCAFCSTGKQGFNRNLSTGGDRRPAVARQPRAAGDGATRLVANGRAPITNVVMMGMGEPLPNFDNVVPALRLMLDDHAYGLSRRRVTVSTSGLVPQIDRLRDDCPVALAVSLHAPDDALRDRLVPINRKYPLAELLAACRRYLERAPRDFITFEYVMLDGVNDSPSRPARCVAPGARRALQVQPDPVQSLSRAREFRTSSRGRDSRRFQRDPARRRARHHRAQDARRRHRGRVRPARRPGAGPAHPAARDIHRARRHRAGRTRLRSAAMNRTAWCVAAASLAALVAGCSGTRDPSRPRRHRSRRSSRPRACKDRARRRLRPSSARSCVPTLRPATTSAAR